MSEEIVASKLPRLSTEELVQMQVLCDREQTDAEIASVMGLPVEVVGRVVKAEGWRENGLLEGEEAVSYEASRAVLLKRWERAVGAKSRWLALRGLSLVENSETPRDFKDAAQGTKLLVEMAREAEGMGKKETAVIGVGISMFFADAEPVRLEKKVVEVEAEEL